MGKAPTKTLARQAAHFFAAVLAYTKQLHHYTHHEVGCASII